MSHPDNLAARLSKLSTSELTVTPGGSPSILSPAICQGTQLYGPRRNAIVAADFVKHSSKWSKPEKRTKLQRRKETAR